MIQSLIARKREFYVPKPIRLLWLDGDDQTVASGIQILMENGWIVDRAHNLVEALDQISRISYDAVILDLQLPDTLGTDAWIYIRRLQPNLIGVMTTGSSSLFKLVRIDSPGLAAYLQKPLSVPMVMRIIAGELNRMDVSVDSSDAMTYDDPV